MKRRTPWALITITVAVLGAVGGLVSSTDAFYSPLVYQYLSAPPDTTVSVPFTFVAANSQVIPIVRKVAGAAGGYGVDTLGVGDNIFAICSVAFDLAYWLNGSVLPADTISMAAAGSVTMPIRWVDSVRVSTTVAGTGDVVINGHKQWFSGGGTY